MVSSHGSAEPPAKWDVPTLIHECLDRSDGAWEEFLRRYSDLIHSCIRRYPLPEEEVRETYQVTVAAVVTSLQNLRDPQRLSSWLIGIAVRQGARRFHLIRRESATDPMESVLDGADDSYTIPESERLALERAQLLRDAMTELSERCRRILTALYLEDPPLTYDQVAEKEAISSGSVGPTRRRCLDGLRVRLADLGPDLPSG